MAKKRPVFDEKNIERLKKFLKQNDDIDIKKYNFQSLNHQDKLKWKYLTKSKRKVLLIVKAYQRILRVMPKDNPEIIIKLLKNNIHSAVQIASLSKNKFFKKWETIIKDNKDIAQQVYSNSLKKRSRLALQYIDILQNNEPHISAARFNK